MYSGLYNNVKIALKKLPQATNVNSLSNMKRLFFLRHPNIGIYLGFYRDKENIFLAMEYFSEGPLKNYLHTHESSLGSLDLLLLYILLLFSIVFLKISFKISSIKHVVKGMIYLTSQNILHQNLALRNLFVAKLGTLAYVKLSDYGIVKFFEDNYQSLGTKDEHQRKWYSPEVLQGGKFSIKSDVWAFGVTAWEILTFGAEIPYSDISSYSLADKIVNNSYRLPKPPACSKEVYSVLLKIFSINPDDRPHFYQILDMLQTQYVDMSQNKSETSVIDPIDLEKNYAVNPVFEKLLKNHQKNANEYHYSFEQYPLQKKSQSNASNENEILYSTYETKNDSETIIYASNE